MADRFFAILRRDAERRLDFHRQKRITPKRIALLALSPEFRLVMWFRIYSSLHQRGLRGVALALHAWIKGRTGCDLAPAAVVGAGLRLGHRSDIVIGAGAVIGRDVYIFNGVSIGKRRPSRGLDDMPQVGDDVVVGTGAKLLGGISIGRGAVIGANSVVINDVADGVTVAGAPARPIQSSRES